MPGRQKPRRTNQAYKEMPVYLAGLRGRTLCSTLVWQCVAVLGYRGFIKSSSAARLTAARRLLTLSLL
jgi:hypothetical protein